jgi:hypothetical protein
MKSSLFTTLLIFLQFVASANAQELRTITTASGALTVSSNSVVQVVGVAMDNTGASSSSRPSIRFTYADGTVITNQVGETHVATGSGGIASSTSSNPIGHVYTGLTKIEVVDFVGASTLKAAVTVKVMTQASEVVSTPMVLPAVDDSLYEITLETSVDMQNWVPSYPGQYLGNGSHRFFRVKSTKKPTANP